MKNSALKIKSNGRHDSEKVFWIFFLITEAINIELQKKKKKTKKKQVKEGGTKQHANECKYTWCDQKV